MPVGRCKNFVLREKNKLIQIYTRFSCFTWLKNKSAPQMGADA
jgi:hypothetical protein